MIKLDSLKQVVQDTQNKVRSLSKDSNNQENLEKVYENSFEQIGKLLSDGLNLGSLDTSYREHLELYQGYATTTRTVDELHDNKLAELSEVISIYKNYFETLASQIEVLASRTASAVIGGAIGHGLQNEIKSFVTPKSIDEMLKTTCELKDKTTKGEEVKKSKGGFWKWFRKTASTKEEEKPPVKNDPEDNDIVSSGDVHSPSSDELSNSSFPKTPVTGEVHDFGDKKGLVYAHRHVNPDGTLGGWVADTAAVDSDVYIGHLACVYGNAQVLEASKLEDCARVYGNAIVSKTKMYRNAAIFEKAVISKTFISDDSKIFGQAQVSNSALCLAASVYGNAVVLASDVFDGEIYENAKVKNARVCGEVCGQARVEGICVSSGGFFTTNPRDLPEHLTRGKISILVMPPGNHDD